MTSRRCLRTFSWSLRALSLVAVAAGCGQAHGPEPSAPVSNGGADEIPAARPVSAEPVSKSAAGAHAGGAASAVPEKRPEGATGTEDTGDDADVMTSADINGTIKAQARALEDCYRGELDRVPELSGTLVLSIRILSTGVVHSVTVVEEKTTLADERVRGCVNEVISRLLFPAKGNAVVQYPFVFSRQ